MDALEGIQVLRSRHDNSIRVGFTGTRHGMTTSQWQELEDLLAILVKDRDVRWHDGDCVGSDDQAHSVINKVTSDQAYTIGHPCNLSKYRAWRDFDELKEELPPLVRNKKIVEQSDIMFAAPEGFDEIGIGSGTWATIRYARRKKKPLIIVWPDGANTLEGM